MIPTWVQGQDMEKLEVVIDYNSGLGGVVLSDTYLTSYCGKRKKVKKYYQTLNVH
jgi:archaellin